MDRSIQRTTDNESLSLIRSLKSLQMAVWGRNHRLLS